MLTIDARAHPNPAISCRKAGSYPDVEPERLISWSGPRNTWISSIPSRRLPATRTNNKIDRPYWNSEENHFKKLLFRLFGCDGQLSWKLTAPTTDPEAQSTDENEYELEDD
jgi:hypothetical protein